MVDMRLELWLLMGLFVAYLLIGSWLLAFHYKDHKLPLTGAEPRVYDDFLTGLGAILFWPLIWLLICLRRNK